MEIDKDAIQTVIQENSSTIQSVQGGDTKVTTQIAETPQIQTTIQDNVATITSIINAPFIGVTTVNGMSGDVVVEAQIGHFESGHYYLKDTVITYNGSIYFAKDNFTSSDAFNADNWTTPDFTQVQADWGQTDIEQKSYIQNKPTKLSQFENDQNYITPTVLDEKGFLTEPDVQELIKNKVDKDSLAAVATSGQYSDLYNVPELAQVALSGSFNDLKDTGVYSDQEWVDLGFKF